MKLQRFEAWAEPDDNSMAFSTAVGIRSQRRQGALSKRARLLYVIRAATWEEGLSIHFLRQGWKPYVPTGKPAKCPKCKAVIYPEGSRECWKCGQK